MSESATETRHAYIQALLPLEKIDRTEQVRKNWRHGDGVAQLDDLTASIKEHGLLQPVLVRPIDGTDRYQLIVGHRRCVSLQRAGEAVAPALVTHATDDEAMVLQLIENIQRQDLDPIDEADALQRLVDRNGLDYAELARRIGKPWNWVAGRLRVARDLELREAVRQGLIAVTVADLLLGLPAPYDRPLRDKLRAGQQVRERDVLQARAKAHADGVHSDRDPHGPIVRAQADRRAQRVRELRAQGLSQWAVAKELGISQKNVSKYERRPIPDAPVPPTEPTYATPKRSPLPWENEPSPGLTVEVDRQYRVEKVGTEPAVTAETPLLGRNPEHIVVEAPPPKTELRAIAPDPLTQLRDLCHPLPTAPLRRLLAWGAHEGLTVADLLDRVNLALADGTARH